MKIIHTLKNTTSGDWFLGLDNFKSILLSVALAKQKYGNIHLYTDSKISEYIKRFEIPYDSIDTSLDEYVGYNFAIPKIYTFSKQTEPFFHIDHDTFLFGKITEKEPNVLFSHPDQLPFKESITYNKSRTFENYLNFFETYVSLFSKFPDLLDETIKRKIDFSYVPNMCVFGGYDYKSISKASKFLLKLYKKNQGIWDSDYYNACVIEQLLMIPALKTVNSEYDNLDTDLIQLNISNVQQISNKTPLTITEYETNKPKNLIVDGISFEFNIENQLDDYESLRYRFHEYLIQNQKITHFSSFKSHTFLRYFTNVLLERLSVEAEFEFLRKIQNKFNGIFDKRNIHYSNEEKIKMKIGII